MRDIFIQLLNMSIVASWMIVAVVIFRFVFKKAPKWIVGMLWCMVGIRLLCPFSIRSKFSLVPSPKTIVVEGNNVVVDTGINGVDATLNAYLQQAYDDADEMTTVSNSEKILHSSTAAILLAVWVVGVCVLILGSIISYIRLKHRLKEATRYTDNVYQTEHIDSPFVFGFFRPVIYVPYRLGEEQLECVIMHEKAHIKRKDYMIKPIGYVLFAIYWFNPLVWLAYLMLCRDIELACDEKVIRELGYDKKKIYSQTLLQCSLPQSMLLACPVAFAEIGVKERVVNVMKLKKTKVGLIIGAFAAVALVTIGFMTNPLAASKKSEETTKPTVMQPTSEDVVAADNDAKEEIEEVKPEETKTEAEIQETKPETESMTQDEQPATQETNNVPAQSEIESTPALAEDEAIEPTTAEVVETTSGADLASLANPTLGFGIITRAFTSDHLAIDFAAPEGTPLVAAFGGTVTATGFDAKNGNYIVITNADGWSVYYNNCQEVSVSVGQSVSAGFEIGTVGSTGQSTGPHVHFALANPSGIFVDPTPYL